jgi:hypothetical protein
MSSQDHLARVAKRIPSAKPRGHIDELSRASFYSLTKNDSRVKEEEGWIVSATGRRLISLLELVTHGIEGGMGKVAKGVRFEETQSKDNTNGTLLVATNR